MGTKLAYTSLVVQLLNSILPKLKFGASNCDDHSKRYKREDRYQESLQKTNHLLKSLGKTKLIRMN